MLLGERANVCAFFGVGSVGKVELMVQMGYPECLETSSPFLLHCITLGVVSKFPLHGLGSRNPDW